MGLARIAYLSVQTQDIYEHPILQVAAKCQNGTCFTVEESPISTKLSSIPRTAYNEFKYQSIKDPYSNRFLSAGTRFGTRCSTRHFSSEFAAVDPKPTPTAGLRGTAATHLNPVQL